MKKSKVVVFTTGGTISSKTKDNSSGYSPSMSGEDLVKSIAGFTNIDLLCDIEVIEFSRTLSFAISPLMVFNLAKEINKKLNQHDCDAVAVTHGTATMEETAFLLDILIESYKPVILTGAMRPASEPDTDGPRNLFYALKVAVSAESKEKGVLVCLDGDIHSARDVLKLHKTSLSTFYSPLGVLGRVDKERVEFLRKPYRRFHLLPEKLEEKVGFVKVVAGMDDFLIKALLDVGIKGLVIEGLPGNGAVTPGVMKGVEAAIKKGVVVVFGSRSPFGRLIASAGGGTGPKDLLNIGAISCGDLSPVKARLLLMVILGAGKSEETSKIFSEIAP